MTNLAANSHRSKKPKFVSQKGLFLAVESGDRGVIFHVVEFQAYKAAALWRTDGSEGNPVLGEIPPDLLHVMGILPEKRQILEAKRSLDLKFGSNQLHMLDSQCAV